MARPFVFPDPDDCSPNSPSRIINADGVLRFYKQQTGERMERVTKKVQDFFCTAATEDYKWDSAKFSGNQCVLTVTMEKRSIDED